MVGMMGCGKTAVGQRVAELTGMTFQDCDSAVEDQIGCSIAEFFETSGEDAFRSVENESLERILQQPARVVATGGGTYVAERNRQLIDRLATAVWIKASLDLLWERVRGKSTRPLLNSDDPFGTLAELLRKREPIYALAPIHVVSRPGASIDDTARLVVSELCAAPVR